MNDDPWAHPNFNLWSVSAKPSKNTLVVEYGKPNDKRFTIRIAHGGLFTDYPGKAYQQTKVHFISYVRHRFVRHGFACAFFQKAWVYQFGELTLARAHKFKEIEHVYVEHRLVFVPKNSPHFLMNSPAKRVEKLIHMFLTEHPMDLVDDVIEYIQHMLNKRIPREEMEDAMDKAKENVVAWKNIA
ncbi:unnamed protein product [Lactuca saligna]|uniref:Uncharacterized protein n=1 Tax=Lactuca saligna TaxID=75948 RepID=A0AA36EH60_LACSI|nr:unnamed protein product [Lactuca saligna]